MPKFNACLSNDAAIFDSCDGFATVADVLDWAAGRGGRYVVQIAREVKGEEVDFISVVADSRRGKTTWSRYFPGGMVPVTAEQIADMI